MGPHRVSKEELMEFAAEKFLTAQKPSWAPTNGVKALAWFGKHACICTIITASFLGEPCLAGWLVFSFSIYSYSAHPIGRPTLCILSTIPVCLLHTISLSFYQPP